MLRRGGGGVRGGERGRGGDGLGVQPVRGVGAAGDVGARAVVVALARGGRRGRAAAAAGARAQGAQRRAARPPRPRRHHRLLAPRAPQRTPRNPRTPRRTASYLPQAGEPVRRAHRILVVSVASELFALFYLFRTLDPARGRRDRLATSLPRRLSHTDIEI